MSQLVFGIILVVVMALIGVAGALSLAIIVLAIRMRRAKQAPQHTRIGPLRPPSEESTVVEPIDTPTVIRRTVTAPEPPEPERMWKPTDPTPAEIMKRPDGRVGARPTITPPVEDGDTNTPTPKSPPRRGG